MKIFEFAAIYVPKGKDAAKAEIIVKPTTILAKDDKQAGMLAARALPEEFLNRLDDIEIAVRPF